MNWNRSAETTAMLTCQKSSFSLPPDQHYLNCAYMSPVSLAVEEAGIAGIRRKRDPASITPDLFFPEADRARALFGRMIHAPASRVAIIPAVSYGMAVVARNLDVGAGANIVVARGQFPSNVHVWRSVCRDGDAELRTVAPPETGPRGKGWNERLLDAIDGRTAAVAIANVHWADGTRFDLEAIGERARAVGAALIVDGTQSIGALPLDVERVQPDAVMAAGYKWLMGPYSIGMMYLGPRFDAGTPLEETWLGRAGSEEFRTLTEYREEYQPGAVRFDVGQRSNFILLPMLNAAMEQLLEWDVGAVQEYCRTLTEPLVDRARAVGYGVEEADGRGSHLFGLRVPRGASVTDLEQRLHARNVIVSTRGGALRISPNVYNDASDMDALAEALIG